MILLLLVVIAMTPCASPVSAVKLWVVTRTTWRAPRSGMTAASCHPDPFTESPSDYTLSVPRSVLWMRSYEMSRRSAKISDTSVIFTCQEDLCPEKILCAENLSTPGLHPARRAHRRESPLYRKASALCPFSCAPARRSLPPGSPPPTAKPGLPLDFAKPVVPLYGFLTGISAT